jgi:sugar lactone lactonase YvrE
MRRAKGLGGIGRGALATRGVTGDDDGSGAPSRGHARLGAIASAVAVIALLGLAPSASAVMTRVPLGFSPITGSGTGVTLHTPKGIGLDETTGNVFVNDGSGGNVVDIFGAEGGVPTGVASPYQLTGFSFNNELSGIAVDNSATSPSKGALYVSDIQTSPRADAVKKYVLNGGTETYELAEILHPSSGPSFNEPEGLTLDKEGNLFVADWGSSTIVEFSPTGTQLARINTTASVGHPSSVALDAAGDLFTQGQGNGKVFKYPANGSGEIEETVFTQILPSGSTGVAVDRATNSLFVALGDHVTEYDATSLAQGLEFGTGSLGATARLVANSANGHVYVADNGAVKRVVVFSAAASFPTVTTDAAAEVHARRATVEGTVNPEGIAVTECKFEYGTTAAYGESAPCEGSIPTDSSDHTVSAELSGLEPSTTYHFRIAATNSNGTNPAADQTFETEPMTVTGTGTPLSGTKVKVTGLVFPEGAPIAECRFQYGESTSYEQSVACAEGPGEIGTGNGSVFVHAVLPGLQPATEYHFRLVAKSETLAQPEAGADATFTTSGPIISGSAVQWTALTATTAGLEALIDPQGQGTSYHVEYVTLEEFEQSGFAAAQTAPPGVNGIGSGFAEVKVEPQLSGLSPATTYVARFVATNVSATIYGPELAFATYPDYGSPGSCPTNEQLRTGPSAHLPDCRAYEQASPVAKNDTNVGGQLFHTEASVSGDAVVFQVTTGIPGGEGSEEFPNYVARRGAENWSTRGMLPPPSTGEANVMKAWTPDLKWSFSRAYRSGLPPGNETFVAHDLSSGATQDVFPEVPRTEETFIAGISEGASKVFVESTVPVSKGGGLTVSGGQAPAAGKDNLYMWDRETGAFTLVGVLPASEGGGTPTGGSFLGPWDWWGTSGTAPNPTRGGASREYFTNGLHAISSDGEKAFFTAATPGLPDNPALYMREGLGGGSPETVEISASQKTDGSGPNGAESNSPGRATFMRATPDGSKVLFTSTEELTDEANTGPELPGPPQAAIGRSTLDGTTSVNQGFVPKPSNWVAVDGGHVYWTNTAIGTIGRANLDGSGAEPTFVTGASAPTGIAVDGAHVYWSNSGSGTIGRANLDGSGVDESFISGASEPQGIAVNGTYIFWANAGNTTLARANLDGSGVNQALINFGGEEVPWGVAVGASQVYWSLVESEEASYVERANFDASGETLTGVSGIVKGVAVNGSNVFWANESGKKIGRSNLTFGERNGSFLATANPPRGMAVDGTHFYWSGIQQTPPLSVGNDLYSYDTESGELTDLSVDNGDPNGAEVQGVVGASDDGEYVYFAANGDLDGGGEATTGNCQIEGNSNYEGSCSLYLWHDGEVTYVARLDASGGGVTADGMDWAPNPGLGGGGRALPTGMVSADGRTLVFRSQLRQTAYDNQRGCHTAVVGKCPEFYRYHVGDPGPTCITCSPTGAPPAGQPRLSSITIGAIGFITNPLLQRNLSSDGDRFFFETTDKLVPADTNGDTPLEAEGPLCPHTTGFQAVGPTCQDVYEWEAEGSGSCHTSPGCYYLVSTGTERTPAFLSDASASGNDAFFFTFGQLVPQDEDHVQDIYDARVNGGLAAQHAVSPPSCEGEGCRGAGTSAPPAAGAGTASFQGPGNPPPAHRKHHKKRHHRKRHHGRAKANRGGGK